MVASYWYAANSFSLQCRAQQQWNAVRCIGVVRRGLLLRDELGRPQWAAISNNLPSLGSTPQSQLQFIALHINYPTTPTTHYPWVHCNIHTAVQCSSGWVESGVLAICAKPLGEPGVGEGVPTLPTMNWRRSKTKAGPGRNQNFIYSDRLDVWGRR